MNAKIVVALFAVLLLALTAADIAVPDRAFSENENRYLATRPDFTVSSLLDGSYTSDFEEYVTDQFAARDTWVGAKTASEVALGKRSSNGVYFADDGYLIETFDELDEEMWLRNLEYVRGFSEKYSDRGIRVNTLLIPTASLVLEDKLPSHAPELDQRALLARAREVIPGFIDVSAAMASHSQEYIYYRTDHHWTSLGAYYAYNSWLGANGQTVRPLDHYDQGVLSDSFYGTTYSKANLYTVPPDTMTSFFPRTVGDITVSYNLGQTVTNTIYERSYLEVKDKYSVYLNANQSVTQIQTGVNNGKRLLLVKDSYANTFAQFLLEDYAEIYVVDLRYFRASLEEHMKEWEITDAIVLYNLKGFSTDGNLFFLLR